MDTVTLDRLIQAVNIDSNLVPFLNLTGWEQVEKSNKRWIVLHGQRDINGQPLELVLPKEGRVEEKQSYIVKALNLLATLKQDNLQLIIQSVVHYDRDLLYIRNTETDDENAIPLNLAINQISNLKQVIGYSATSEKEPKPYFFEQTTTAKRLLGEFLFGHTFAGSFGFTVEAPRLPDPPRFIQERLPLEEDQTPSPVNVPLERRVMERIARGLMFSKQAEQERDHSILLREYLSGFNANMCSALVGISQERKATVEFRITWSPKIQPGEDIAEIQPIKLRGDGYDILDYAAKQLRSLKPETVKVIGHIKALTASDNPQSLGTRRAVVIRGTYPGTQRLLDIIVELDREDYAKATTAHLSWSNIQVNGIISRSGTSWRLSNPQNFQVL